MPGQLDGRQSSHILFHDGQQETLGIGVWMMPVRTFGDYIRDARLRMKLGLRRAADLLGMSPSYLSKVETNDAREPSGELLHRMARLYELSIPDMMEQVRLRADDMIAADDELGPTIHAFYRLAQGQPLQVREKMLRAAVDVLDLPEGQKERLRIMLARLLSHMHGQDLPRLGSGSAGLFALEVRPRFLSADRIERRAEQILESYFERPIASIELPIPIEDIAEQIDPDVRVIVDSDLPGGRLRDGSPAVLGMSRWSHDAETRELVLNAELFEAAQPTARRRCSFTTAHELFHCLEHLPLMSLRNPRDALKRRIMSMEIGDPMGQAVHRFPRRTAPRRLSTNEEWREWQANRFAAAILMPAPLVRAAVRSIVEQPLVVDSEEKARRLANEIVRTEMGDDGRSLVELFDVNPQPMAIRLLTLGIVGDARRPV